MGFRNSPAVLILLTFICYSRQSSPAKELLPTIHDEGLSVTIVLSSAAFQGESSIEHVIGPNSTISVHVDPTSVQNATFMIFQVHSYVKPLVLSFEPTLINGQHVNGTDTGLYSKLSGKTLTYYIINCNSEPVSLLLVPIVYGSEDPVPGGCNLSFSVSVAPLMTLTYQADNEIVQVDAQAAAIQDQADCKPLGLTYEVYELDVLSTSVDSYFKGILSVVTAKNAQWRGFQTRKPIHQPELRRRFASYPGFGAIYVAVVRDARTGKSSAYVPIAKYGCIEGNEDNCCTYYGSVWAMSICAGIFVLAEIRYILGGNIRLVVKAAFTLGTIITLGPALPPSLRWTLLGFLGLAFVVVCIVGQVGQAFVLCTEHAYALVPAHLFFGLFLYGGLGMVSGFQDWLIVTYTFGLFFLVFYILGILFPDREQFEPLFGIFLLVALVSAVTNRLLFYVYVDPSRILKQDFADVIFSPPLSLIDNLMLTSVPLLLCLYNLGRKTFEQRNSTREYEEIGPSPHPPPYSSLPNYRSL